MTRTLARDIVAMAMIVNIAPADMTRRLMNWTPADWHALLIAPYHNARDPRTLPAQSIVYDDILSLAREMANAR